MAQLVVAAAGAAVGFMVGGPAGAKVGWVAGTVLGGVLFAPDAPNVSSPRLGDLSVSGTSYGNTIPYAQGSNRVGGVIIWASQKREIATTTSQGGKGGGGGGSSTQYTYEVDLMYELTDNEIEGVAKIWLDGKLVWVAGAAVPVDLWAEMTVYKGLADQLPDPTYEASLSGSPAPAYRGRGTVVFRALQLGGGGVIPNMSFEIALARPPYYCVKTDGATENFHKLDGGSGVSILATASPSEGFAPGFCYVKSLDAFYVALGHVSPGPGKDNRIARYNPKTDAFDQIIRAAPTTAVTVNAIARVFGVIVAEESGEHLWAAAYWWTTSLETPFSVYKINTATQVSTEFIFAAPPWTSSPDFPQSNSATLGTMAVNREGTNLYVQWQSPVFTGTTLTGYVGHISLYNADTGAEIVTISAPRNTAGVAGEMRLVVSRDSTRLYYAFGGSRVIVYDATTLDLISEIYGANPARDVCESEDGAFLFIGGNTRIIRVDSTTLDFINDRTITFAESGSDVPVGAINLGPNRELIVSSLGQAVAENVLTMSQDTFDITSFDFSGGSDTISRGLWRDKPDIVAMPVSELVTKLCLRAGMAADQFDVSGIESIQAGVHGIAVSQITTTRNTLETLMFAYFFSATMSDKIYFHAMGSDPKASIPFAALGVGAGGGEEDPLPLVKANDIEIPGQYSITYSNLYNAFQTDVQFSDRIVSEQRSVNAQQLPMVFTSGGVKAIADARLADALASALTSQISLGVDYARLEPTDVVTVEDSQGNQFRFRITSRREEAGVFTFELAYDDPSALQQAGVTSATEYVPPALQIRPLTNLYVMDIPLLRDADDTTGIYTAVKSRSSPASWTGAVINTSPDNLTYTEQATVTSQAVVGDVWDWEEWTGGNVFDEVSYLYVGDVIGGQTLSSVTREEILNDSTVNLALFGNELIQYREAILQAPGEYLLTGLLRGRRGTSQTDASFVYGPFIKISTSGITFIPLSNAEIGAPVNWRAVSFGTTLAAATTITATPLSVNKRCLAAVDARANRETNDTVVTWKRSTRLFNRLVGALPISCPLGEDSEEYDVEVWNATFTVLIRSFLDLPSASVTYTSAQQVTDFGVNQTALRVRIYQKSATTGRGRVYQATI
jgi:hypothetical protein